MRRLREQEPMLMGDEEHHNLFDGIQDIRYARDFLHVVGPLGTAEHARFDEMSWGYGDPTYMGGDLLEVFDSQLKSVVHTLFGAHGEEEANGDGDDLCVDLHHASVACGEDDFLADLIGVDGGPVEADTIQAVSPGSMAEHLAPSRTGRRRDYPGKGVASIGCGGISSLGYRIAQEPTGDFEDVIGIEISGARGAVKRFTRYLRAGCGEGEAPGLYRWKSGSTAGRMLGERPREARDAVVLLVGFEYFDLRSMMQDIVFARLLAAWREAKRQPPEGTGEPVERSL